jgi:hypothetical protein
LRLSPARVPAGPDLGSVPPEPWRSASSRQLYPRRSGAVFTPGKEVIRGLAGRLTPRHEARPPTVAGADEQDSRQPPPPPSESRRGLGAHAVPDLTVCGAAEAAILDLHAVASVGAAPAGLS